MKSYLQFIRSLRFELAFVEWSRRLREKEKLEMVVFVCCWLCNICLEVAVHVLSVECVRAPSGFCVHVR